MDVLMVAAELGPHARETSASDAIAALAKTIRQLGHTVTVALPKTAGFDGSGLLLARRLSPLVLSAGSNVTLFDAQLPSGVALALFDAPEFADSTPENEGRRMATLVRAVAAWLSERRDLGKKTDVVHIHDPRLAPLAALLGPSGPPCLLQIHELTNEPLYGAQAWASVSAAAGGLSLNSDPRSRVGARVSPLRFGLPWLRFVTTVSAGYAAMLNQGPLSELWGALSEPVLGVPQGIDYALYNPATDPAIPNRFDAEDVSNKGRCKSACVRSSDLDLVPEQPLLVALLSSLDAEARAALLEAAPKVVELGMQVLFAGPAEPEVLANVEKLREVHPLDVAHMEVNDDVELRRWVAAADFALTGRRHAPFCHVELVAQRYGAVPIAAATGGAADVVVDLDAELETGTGFLYAPGSSSELLAVLERAYAAFGHERFPGLRRRIMRRDMSWDRAARRYVQLYGRAITGASASVAPGAS